ncbi:MAG TPA: polysaccharide pyruvyl transferase family protein [Candidatus Eisenbacteria bacterium]|nr:polysaccharide pyruvyl transferase family protein [Candidatus Eisenbacteria bacterium]
MPPRRIGVLGHVGNGNLGDEALIASVLQGVRDRIPDAEILAFTIRPEDTRARHGIPAVPLVPGIGAPPEPALRARVSAPVTADPRPSPLRRVLGSVPGALPLVRGLRGAPGALRAAAREAAFWPERLRALRGLDLLVVAGSNQISDNYGGPWAFPYTLAAWTAAARLTGVPVAYLSVGAGPIRSPLSRRLLRAALGWAAYRSYRDVGSREWVAGIGLAGPHRIVPDLVHGLAFDVPAESHGAGDAGRTIVVNPFPYRDPRFTPGGDRDAYERYVEILAGLAAHVLARGDRVRFVPTQLRQDPLVIEDILEALARRGAPLPARDALAPSVTTFEDLVRALAAADLVIATRFHGVVLAQMLGKPVLGIAYRRSTTDLLQDVGQEDYAIEGASLTLEGLLERLGSLESDAGAADRIHRRVLELRRAVGLQYDEVLSASPARERSPAFAGAR